MDYMAIASYGVYPTPTPTDPQRAAFVATHGLFAGPLSAVVAAGYRSFLSFGRKPMVYLNRMLKIG